MGYKQDFADAKQKIGVAKSQLSKVLKELLTLEKVESFPVQIWTREKYRTFRLWALDAVPIIVNDAESLINDAKETIERSYLIRGGKMKREYAVVLRGMSKTINNTSAILEDVKWLFGKLFNRSRRGTKRGKPFITTRLKQVPSKTDGRKKKVMLKKSSKSFVVGSIAVVENKGKYYAVSVLKEPSARGLIYGNVTDVEWRKRFEGKLREVEKIVGKKIKMPAAVELNERGMPQLEGYRKLLDVFEKAIVLKDKELGGETKKPGNRIVRRKIGKIERQLSLLKKERAALSDAIRDIEMKFKERSLVAVFPLREIGDVSPGQTVDTDNGLFEAIEVFEKYRVVVIDPKTKSQIQDNRGRDIIWNVEPKQLLDISAISDKKLVRRLKFKERVRKNKFTSLTDYVIAYNERGGDPTKIEKFVGNMTQSDLRMFMSALGSVIAAFHDYMKSYLQYMSPESYGRMLRPKADMIEFREKWKGLIRTVNTALSGSDVEPDNMPGKPIEGVDAKTENRLRLVLRTYLVAVIKRLFEKDETFNYALTGIVPPPPKGEYLMPFGPRLLQDSQMRKRATALKEVRKLKVRGGALYNSEHKPALAIRVLRQAISLAKKYKVKYPDLLALDNYITDATVLIKDIKMGDA